MNNNFDVTRWRNVLWIALAAVAPLSSVKAEESEIRLIVRGDDMGFCHAVNVACIQCFQDGIMRSVEVMVPGPWYLEAVAMLKDHPGLDVGVHLTLNAEWVNYRWAPVTKAPSLVDRHGYFDVRLPRPGRSRLLESENTRPFASLEDLERELDAQIALAVADIPSVSHLTCHMGTPVATPELRAIVEKLSKKYGLPWETPGVKRAGSMGGAQGGSAEKHAAMLEIVEQLASGTYLLVEHPGLDTPEMQAIGTAGGGNIAASRFGVTHAWTSPQVKQVIARRGIRLISYADYLRK